MPLLTNRSRPQEPPKGLPPVKTFFALLLLVAIVTVVGLLQANDNDVASDPPSRSSSSGGAVPTEEEALATFKRLERLWEEAYRTRDVSLIDTFAAPDAVGMFAEIDDELRQLKADHVLYQPRLEDRRIEVTSVSETQIRLQEIVTETPRFIHEKTGDNVTKDKTSQRLTVSWTLRRYDTGWRIYRSLVTDVRNLHRS